MALESVLPIVQEALKSAAPILLATLGAVVGQRAGVLNLGIEGVLYLSAAVAALVGPPWGVVAAVIVGTLYNLLYYFLANDMALSQILLGFAFTMVGYGVGAQLAQSVLGKPIERPVLYGVEAFVVAVAAAAALHLFFKSKIGIAIKASGDDPPSLDLMGVDVYHVRRIAGAIEGLFVSSAGAYLVLFYFGKWSEPLVMGWGSLAVITAMISLWTPLVAIGASLIPSTFIALSYILQRVLQTSPHLLNIVPFVAPVVVLTVLQLVEKSRIKTAAPRWLAKPYIREERA